MEIAKKKVFYTTFAALILSSFTLQTGKADEVQVKPDEAKIDYVNSALVGAWDGWKRTDHPDCFAVDR